MQKYQKVKPRDIKPGANFAWLKQVQAPAVLCENFFVDGPNAAVYARQDALKQLAKQGTAIVYVGHQLEKMEQFCNQIWFIKNGKVVRGK